MARFTHLKIYKDSFSLFLKYNTFFPNISKKYKYTLGAQIQTLLLENFRLIIRINRIFESSKKKLLIEKMIVNLEEVLILFRTLQFLKEISKGLYLEISATILELLKQAEGWLKFETQKLSSNSNY